MLVRSLLYLFLVFSVASCQQDAPSASKSHANDGFSRKHEPIDANLDLRLGVRGDFSYAVYAAAIKEATQNLASRSTPEGFDEPWVVEGPFTEGGRVDAIYIDPRNPATKYLGFTRSGLWRTTNNGQDWQPISDQLTFPSIGSIKIDTARNRIWIGTGDPNISGYFYTGDGIYYSDDDGTSWINSGLGETGVISDIEIDPRNSDVIYAATMGLPYEGNTDRGLYKSIDRGVTWNQILFDSITAGISALHVHPTNPDILFATGWDRQRTQFSSVVSGNHSKLWRSIDAGQTWTDMQSSVGYTLPSGRLGFAISPNDPDRMYISVTDDTSRFGGFFRTDNGGVDWTRTAQRGQEATTGLDGSPFGGFGWYFGETRVDPNDEDHVWMLGVRLWESFDGGYTWSRDDETNSFFRTHADNHALEVGADGEVWLGTDGGAYRRDLSSTEWIDAENLPTNMIYRVADYPSDTLSYACGMQDNGTSLGGDLPTPEPWYEIFGGDGFQSIFNGFDTASMLVETQNGRIWQVDLVDGFVDEVTPFNSTERRSWDAPIASLYDSVGQLSYLLTGSNIAYQGEYDVPPYFESDDQLLTSDPDNRYYIISAAHIASDMTSYIGTSEGWIWKKDGFYSGDWQRINTGFPERYVTDITSSPDDPSVVYVSMGEYRSGNAAPYVLKSVDAGLTWNSIQGDLPQIAVNSFLSLPGTNDSVLVAGTDAGVFASVNGGLNYSRLGTSMINVAVFDLAYDAVNTKLIAGTFGRSLQTYSMKNIIETDIVSSFQESAFAKTERTLLAYPNPTSGAVCLEATLLEVSRGSSLELLNLNGQTLQAWEFAAGQQKLKPCIDIQNDVPNGQYLFRLTNRHDEQLVKVVLER